MKLELRNIKHSEFASEETHCYQARVYVNGKPCITVGNDGHGGSDYQHAIKGAPHTVREINDWCKANFPKRSYDFGEGQRGEYDTDLEVWCHERVADFLIAGDLRKALRSRVLVEDGGKLMEYRWKGVRTITPRHVQAIVADPKMKGKTILNCCTFEKALQIYRRHVS